METITRNGVSYRVVGTVNTVTPPKPIVLAPSGPDCRVGTQLKHLLSTKWNIRAGTKCECNAKAAEIDKWSCEECRQRKDLIVQMLMSGAAERWWIKPLLMVMPGVAASVTQELVEEAITAEEQRTMR